MSDLLRRENLPDQIAYYLRERIRGVEGRAPEWKPGERLPSEQELATEYGVSRQTMRRALATLQNEGLIVSRQGLGTFVKDVPLCVTISHFKISEQRPGFGPWEALLDDLGLPGHTQMITTLIIEAGPEVAKALGIQPTDLVVQRITHQHAGDPDQVVQIQDGRIPLRLPDGRPLAEGTAFTRVERMADGIYATFREIGFTPWKTKPELTAVLPTSREAAVFGVDAGTPMVQMTRVTRTEQGDLIEWRRVIGPGYNNIFSYEVEL